MSETSEESQDYLGNQAYHALRRALRDGGISPGRYYSETEFADMLGVSRTPVREALKALEREGVVIAARRRGYQIREFTEAEVDEVAALREQLEVLVARAIAGSHSQQDLDLLADVLARQEADPTGRAMFALDEEFHLLLAERAGLHRTRSMLEGLRSVMAAATAGASIPDTETAQRIAEHHGIFAAIAQGDRTEAVRLMRAHVRASDRTYREAVRAAASAGPLIKPIK